MQRSDFRYVDTVGHEMNMVRKALLVCGILSSLLYVAIDIYGALQFEGYSYASQAISELTAIGAPTRHAGNSPGIARLLGSPICLHNFCRDSITAC